MLKQNVFNTFGQLCSIKIYWIPAFAGIQVVIRSYGVAAWNMIP
jgi:hypothetical protein